MKVIILLANGFEELEAITQIDYLRRAGVEVTTASIRGEKKVIGQSMIALEADEILSEVNYEEYDMVVLPGGVKGMENLRANEQVIHLIKSYDEKKKWIAAICAAPSILGELGLLNNRNCICYPGYENRLQGGRIVNERVVQDGHIITSKGPGTSLDFAIKIVEALCGAKKASEIAAKTQM